MKIAILGSGGREHAIAYTISKSKKLKNLLLTGNAGTENVSVNININIKDFNEIYKFIKEKNRFSNNRTWTTIGRWYSRFFRG